MIFVHSRLTGCCAISQPFCSIGLNTTNQAAVLRYRWHYPKVLFAIRSLQCAQRNNRETFKHDRAIIGKQLQAPASAARKDLACEHGAPAIGKDLQQGGVYQDKELDEVVARA